LTHVECIFFVFLGSVMFDNGILVQWSESNGSRPLSHLLALASAPARGWGATSGDLGCRSGVKVNVLLHGQERVVAHGDGNHHPDDCQR
jgi:hypothetical protein